MEHCALKPVRFIPYNRERAMVTFVATEADFSGLIKNLILLEHDAIAAYDSCIERLDDRGFADQISSFRNDHTYHLQVLNRIAAELGVEAPTEGDMKQYLTTGKLALVNIFGDKALLRAMKTNEDDTVAAYEEAARHQGAFPESKAFFLAAFEDERRHRDWMAATVEAA
jgi:rubrerythrin